MGRDGGRSRARLSTRRSAFSPSPFATTASFRCLCGQWRKPVRMSCWCRRAQSASRVITASARARWRARSRTRSRRCKARLVGDAPWSPAVDFNAGAAGIYVPSEQGVSDTGILAEGTLNAAEWVTATIDLARLKRVRETGEMHNYADWALQPGVPTTKVTVEIVKLSESIACFKSATSMPT